MKQYVCGFGFHDDSVVLIQKRRPHWQAGLYNGVGGEVEEGEAPADAMSREFHEETGVFVHSRNWNHFASMTCIDRTQFQTYYRVLFFRTTGSWLVACRTTGDESIIHVPLRDLWNPSIPIIPNLRWLIGFCFDNTQYGIIDLAEVNHA